MMIDRNCQALLAVFLFQLLIATSCLAHEKDDIAIFDSDALNENLLSEPDQDMDMSWPTQHEADEHYLSWNPAKLYHDFRKECAKFSSEEICDRNEKERIMLNRNQPPSMTNFTTLGYAKVPIPEKAFRILSNFWNNPVQELEREEWSRGSTYVNHWSSPTDISNVNRYMPPKDLRKVEWDVKQVLEGWTGVSLVPTSMYGIRVYGRGAVLAPHVDRLPLVISAILNVDQSSHDDEENDDDNKNKKQPHHHYHDWPLQVKGHDGKVVNINLKPGEMILYESHSVIHGRPNPFEGDFYANMFVHFEPIGYTHTLEQTRMRAQQDDSSSSSRQNEASTSAKNMFQFLLKKQQEAPTAGLKAKEVAPSDSGSSFSRLPPYKLTHEEESRWRQDYHFVREQGSKEKKPKMTAGTTNAHALAAGGLLEKFQKAVAENPILLHQTDINGWKPIHEAARGGHVKVLEYLIEEGVEVNDRTNEDRGGTALWWTLQYFPDNHPAAQLLRRHGGVPLPPRGNV